MSVSPRGRRGGHRDRGLAWLVTGPLGRLIAFALDFVAALWRGARGRPDHPEERKWRP